MGTSQSTIKYRDRKHKDEEGDEVFYSFSRFPKWKIEIGEMLREIMEERRRVNEAGPIANGACIAAEATLAEDQPPSYEEAISGAHEPVNVIYLPLPDHCHSGRIKIKRRNSI